MERWSLLRRVASGLGILMGLLAVTVSIGFLAVLWHSYHGQSLSSHSIFGVFIG